MFTLAAAAMLILMATLPVHAHHPSPGAGVTVRLVTLNAPLFQHHLLLKALDDLGYMIAAPQEVDDRDMLSVLGAGGGDFTAAYQSDRHRQFFAQAGGDAVLTKIGPYLDNAATEIVVTNDFLAQNPAAAKLFELVRLDAETMAMFNKKMIAGKSSTADIAAHLDAWISTHREIYNYWLIAARREAP